MNAPANIRFVNVHEAKTNYSKLLERARAGEEIVLAKDGMPVAKMVPYDAPKPKKRVPGRFKDFLSDIPDSVWFDPLPDDELALWEGRGNPHDPAL